MMASWEDPSVASSAGRHETVARLSLPDLLPSPLAHPPTHPLQGDFKFEPKASGEGRMWTPGAIDFFRILNEQVAVVAEVNQDAMLLRVGQVRKGWSLDGVFCCCPC